MSIKDIKNKIKPILKRHDVKRASIFGSYARGEQKKKSDVDILIEYRNDDKSLFDLAELQIELEEKLKKKVDLGEYSNIRPQIKDRILNEQVFIL
ncbi:MAG: nucleotidyltransferase family protein [Candidatus Staskawiczbacteria bacterium]|nr:nucleotidyltransferase family protein [Candidatus Staskawiczbacteria bacterium]